MEWKTVEFKESVKSIGQRLWANVHEAMPKQCLQCGLQTTQPHLLCQHCDQDLARLPQQDLLNLPAVAEHIKHKHLDALYSVMRYQYPVKNWLIALKYQQRLSRAKVLAYLVADYFIENGIADGADTIVTQVPVSLERWAERGFNQCYEILKHIDLSRHNYQPHLIFNLDSKRHQVGLKGRDRRVQKRAFLINPRVNVYGQRIVLFDDVITTGATVNAIAGELKKAGAREVVVITLAITLAK